MSRGRSTNCPGRPEPSGANERPPWARLHLWQIQPVRDLFVAAGIVLLLFAGERASIVTVPIVAAILLAYVVEPLVRGVTRTGRIGRRPVALAFLLAGFVFFLLPLTIAAGFAVVQGAELAEYLAGRAGAVVASVESPEDEALRAALEPGAWRDIRDFLVEVGSSRPDVASEGAPAGEPARLLGIDGHHLARSIDAALVWVRENARRLAQELLASGADLLGSALHALGSIGSLLFMLFLTGFFFFFACTRWEAVTRGAEALLPQKNRDHAVAIAREMDRAVSGFIRGRLIVALILGCFYTLSFALIGVPAPLLLGPGIAFLAIFPYAPLLGLPVAIALLWLEPHAGIRGELWWVVLMPLAVYQVGQMLDDYVLTPRIQGDATGLDTPTILAASLAGGALLGLFGLLIAIPLAACIRILVREVLVPRYREWTAGKRLDFLPLDED